MLKYLALLPLAISPLAAQAQSTGWTLGAVGISSDGDFSAFPLIQYEEGPWTLGGQSLLSYAPGNEEAAVQTSFGLGFDMGQDSAGAPQVGFSTTLEASVTYAHPFFEASADWERRLDSKGGSLLSLSLASGYPVSPNLFLAVSLGTSQADQGWRETYYGVSSAGSLGTDVTLAAIGRLDQRQSYVLAITQSSPNADLAGLSFVDEGGETEVTLSYAYSL